MAKKKATETPFLLADSMLTAYATNHRINVYLIQHLPDEAWRVKGPGGKGRDAASMIGHMHNVRLMWLKAIGIPAEAMPAKLEGETFAQSDAIEAMEASWKAMETVLRNAIATDGRIKNFKPDVGSFLGYLFAHDAHHRGQISMLARLVGHPVPQSAMFGMWEWGTR